MSSFPVEEVNAPYGQQIEAEDWLERPDHPLDPLLNHLILEKLFVHVRRYDLKACRGVCKKWNVLTIPHMRSTYRVLIQGSQSNWAADVKTRQMNHFMGLFRSNELGIPFAKFKLGPFCTTDGVGLEFLELCGKTVTEVEFYDYEGRISEFHTIEDVYQLLKFTPNLQFLGLPFRFVSRTRSITKLFSNSIPKLSCLKKLTIRIYPDSLKDWVNYCPSYIEEIFTAAPNISEIEVLNYTSEESEAWDSKCDWSTRLGGQEASSAVITVLLNVIEKLGKESFIQYLRLDFVTIDDINQLQRMGKNENGLKLKRFEIYPDWSRRDLDIHESEIQLVTLFQDTLQFLNLEDHALRATTLAQFPRMPNLNSLYLSILWNIDSVPVQMDLNKHFPVLDTLELYFTPDSCVDEWDECLTNFEPCPTLKSLFLANSVVELRAFHDILRVFPNLTKLDLTVGENGGEILRGIWTQMTQLVSLSIRSQIIPRKDLDSVFTGIPTDVLNDLRPILNELDQMTPELRRDTILRLTDKHSQLPSIRNLTNLRHLNLNENTWPRPRKDLDEYVSDLTGFLALYSMSHLRHLKIEYCGFTKTCCEILIADIGLDTWSFEGRNCGEVIIPSFGLKVD